MPNIDQERDALPDINTLISTPYSEVSTVFSGFIPPQALRRYRGGHVVNRPTYADRCPFTADENFAPGYRLESSFDPVQRGYAFAALHCLDEIALGRSPVGEAASYRALVKNNVLSGKEGFRAALYQADIDLLKHFGVLHPNLMPAMRAVYLLAGFQGLTEAVNSSEDFLRMAYMGEMSETNITEVQENLLAHYRFVGAKKGVTPKSLSRSDGGFSADDPYIYEIRCLGELAAKTLIKESGYAAIELTTEESYRDRVKAVLAYLDQDPNATNGKVAEMLKITVDDLSSKARVNSTVLQTQLQGPVLERSVQKVISAEL